MERQFFNPDNRPLPEGWSQHYESSRGVWYYVQINATPPTVSFAHPADQTPAAFPSPLDSRASTYQPPLNAMPQPPPLRYQPPPVNQPQSGGMTLAQRLYASANLSTDGPSSPIINTAGMQPSSSFHGVSSSPLPSQHPQAPNSRPLPTPAASQLNGGQPGSLSSGNRASMYFTQATPPNSVVGGQSGLPSPPPSGGTSPHLPLSPPHQQPIPQRHQSYQGPQNSSANLAQPSHHPHRLSTLPAPAPPTHHYPSYAPNVNMQNNQNKPTPRPTPHLMTTAKPPTQNGHGLHLSPPSAVSAPSPINVRPSHQPFTSPSPSSPPSSTGASAVPPPTTSPPVSSVLFSHGSNPVTPHSSASPGVSLPGSPYPQMNSNSQPNNLNGQLTRPPVQQQQQQFSQPQLSPVRPPVQQQPIRPQLPPVQAVNQQQPFVQPQSPPIRPPPQQQPVNLPPSVQQQLLVQPQSPPVQQQPGPPPPPKPSRLQKFNQFANSLAGQATIKAAGSLFTATTGLPSQFVTSSAQIVSAAGAQQGHPPATVPLGQTGTIMQNHQQHQAHLMAQYQANQTGAGQLPPTTAGPSSQDTLNSSFQNQMQAIVGNYQQTQDQISAQYQADMQALSNLAQDPQQQQPLLNLSPNQLTSLQQQQQQIAQYQQILAQQQQQLDVQMNQQANQILSNGITGGGITPSFNPFSLYTPEGDGNILGSMLGGSTDPTAGLAGLNLLGGLGGTDPSSLADGADFSPFTE